MIKIGLPAGVQSVMNSLSGMIMTSAINSLGTVAVASNTAYAKLDGIYWMVSNAFAVAIATFVAQNLGANKMKRVHQSIRICLALDLFLSGCISLFFFTTSIYQIIISCPISWLFTALVTLGYYLIRIQRYKLD